MAKLIHWNSLYRVDLVPKFRRLIGITLKTPNYLTYFIAPDVPLARRGTCNNKTLSQQDGKGAFVPKLLLDGVGATLSANGELVMPLVSNFMGRCSSGLPTNQERLTREQLLPNR